MLPCRGVIYHVPNTLIFAERNVNRVVEQSEKITPLRLTPLLANEYLYTIFKMQIQILNTLQ